MNNLLREYFQFSKQQQRAVYTLLILISFAQAIYVFMPSIVKESSSTAPNQKSIDSILSYLEQKTKMDTNSNYSLLAENSKNITPFSFNPNTLSEDGFRRLGLRTKLISTILNYRNKGGIFYTKESLQRMYGLQQAEYEKLKPYIQIPANNNHLPNTGKKTTLYENKIIELNSADTTMLIAMNGIGSKLAQNIVRYRQQLGGFVRIDQLLEIHGMSNDNYQKIKPFIRINKSKIKTISLNKASYYDFNGHPYFKGELAKAICDYRKEHNYHIASIEEIKEIAWINDELFRKIVPYLVIHE